jgi:glycosyltransferase involved in cell wall biosynthesis
VYCNHIRTTEYIRNHSITKIADLVDAISKNYRRSYRYSNILKKPLYWLEKRRVLQYERQIITEFDHSFIVSESDKKFICSKTSEADGFSVLPNGVRSEYIEESDNMNYTSDNLYLVFLGKMDYYPNIDAVKYFSKHIFPNIQKNHPRVSFDIVGGSPSSDIKMLDRYSQINVTGFVDDPRKYIERGTIFVAPMRTGAGVQNKILEAMALKKPVVTTSIGLEGIKAENKKHILVADSEEEFSDAINYLLLNPDARARIGRKARELIKKRYTWESVEDHILGITNQLLTSMNHK